MIRETEGTRLKLIIQQLKLPISASTLYWHFLMRGVESPRPVALPRIKTMVMRRGTGVLTRFSPHEDMLIQRLSKQGLGPAQIGRQLVPPRRHNSVKGRLATLARHQERALETEEAA